MAGWSLRNRLMALAAAGSLLAWLIGGAAVLIAAREESHALYDARLQDVAAFILAIAEGEVARDRRGTARDVMYLDAPPPVRSRYRYQVWSADATLLMASRDAPREPFVPLATSGHLHAPRKSGMHGIVALWSADHAMQIQVAESEALRETLPAGVDGHVLVFAALSAVALVLLSGWVSVRTMRALSQSSDQLAHRSAADLQPIVVDNPPRELKTLIDAINGLVRRFARMLEGERQFTAAAAHELKSPLAAVRIQAQIAERARVRDQRDEALRQLGVCVDRTSHMVDQLLTLAHVDAMGTSCKTAVDLRLHDLAARVIGDMAPLLSTRRIALETDLQPAALFGIEFGVAALLRNLIDNAARYCPERGRVRVSSGVIDGKAFFAVDDSGPGIPAEQRINVFRRFHRLDDTGADGCGVGLSIVQSVARVHGARIELANSDLCGLRAVVWFPRAAS